MPHKAPDNTNGKVTRDPALDNLPMDTSKEVHFNKNSKGEWKLSYTVVKFNGKDMAQINALIEDLETNVGLRDVSAADLLIMLVNRYRLQRKNYKDKSKL